MNELYNINDLLGIIPRFTKYSQLQKMHLVFFLYSTAWASMDGIDLPGKQSLCKAAV